MHASCNVHVVYMLHWHACMLPCHSQEGLANIRQGAVAARGYNSRLQRNHTMNAHNLGTHAARIATQHVVFPSADHLSLSLSLLCCVMRSL